MKKKRVYLIELIVAIICSFKLINYSLVKILDVKSGGLLNSIFLACVFIYLIIIFCRLLGQKKIEKRKVKISFLGVLFVFFSVMLYFINIHKTSLSIFEFLIYFLFSIHLGINEKISIEKLLKYIMIVSLISLLCFDKLFFVYWYGSVDMDISYAFLPTVCAAILHCLYFRKDYKNKIFNFFLYCINGYFLIQLFLYGERGTLVCISLLLILCFIFKMDKDKNIMFDRQSNFKLVIISVCFFFLLIFYKEVLLFLSNIVGIRSYAINKIFTLSTSDISNGRIPIYIKSLNGFTNSPIFGNGISTFYYFTGENYPHNLFLQLLHDGGLMLFSFFVYIFIDGIALLLKSRDRNNIITLFYFNSISILYLCFSNDIWVIPSLWFFIGFLIRIISESKEELINENINRLL